MTRGVGSWNIRKLGPWELKRTAQSQPDPAQEHEWKGSCEWMAGDNHGMDPDHPLPRDQERTLITLYSVLNSAQ